MSVTSHGPEPCASANSAIPARVKKLVDGDGFEPSKSTTTDLQSAPFGRSGTHPRKVIGIDYLVFKETLELVMGLEPATC